MYNILKNWIGLHISKIFFKVWPPEGEEKISDIDINLCIVFDERKDNIYELYRDIDDIWTPLIKKCTLPKDIYPSSMFKLRMENWMRGAIDEEFKYEYYAMHTSSYFDTIINKKIKEILLIYANEIKEPFGLKIHTEKDYILSIPNADGSTLMTKKFNQNNKLENFGEIKYENIV